MKKHGVKRPRANVYSEYYINLYKYRNIFMKQCHVSIIYNSVDVYVKIQRFQNNLFKKSCPKGNTAIHESHDSG